MTYALIALAGFLTWFSSRRRNILVTIISSLLWFAVAMRLFFSATPVLDLSESHVQVLSWVFMSLVFVPIVFFMNQEIRKEKKGVSWTEYGKPPPEDRKSEYEKYADDLHARMYRHKKKRRLL